MSRLAAVSTLVVLISSSAFAQPVPPLLNYQGQLTDAAGNPLATGAYDVTFNVFNDPTLSDPSNLVWGPQTINVQVVNGYFNVVLSDDTDGDPITDAFTDVNRYFQIEIDGGGPILPRQQVLTSPYSARADSGGGEIGDVVASLLTESQFYDLRGGGKWVLCDGRSVDAGSAAGGPNGSRYTAITGNTTVADLRGRFPLGRDGSADRVDPAFEPGSDTIGGAGGDDTVTLLVSHMPGHNHTLRFSNATDNGTQPASARQIGGSTGDDAFVTLDQTTSAGGGNSHQNMPPFLTVNYFCRIN